MESIIVPGRRLGRRPPDVDRPALLARHYLTGVVPAHPVAADHLSGVPQWMLGGNDAHGTCGPTMAANLAVLVRAVLVGQDVTVADAAVFDLYRRSGNPHFNPDLSEDDPRQEDNGVVVQEMLEEWVRGGLEITHFDGSTEVVRPLAFAKVDPTNLDELRAAVSIFGAIALGADLEIAQRSQTDAGGPWNYISSAEWGGHAFMGGQYTSATGRGQTDVTVVTWAELMGTTDTFVAHQVEEAWLVLFAEHLQHPAVQAGVDLAALAADYETITGRPFPADVPPAPGPAPTPAPPAPPENVWELLEQAAESLPEPLRDYVANVLRYFEAQAGTTTTTPKEG